MHLRACEIVIQLEGIAHRTQFSVYCSLDFINLPCLEQSDLAFLFWQCRIFIDQK